VDIFGPNAVLEQNQISNVHVLVAEPAYLHLCVCVLQVIEGGNYDVDVVISTRHNTLYKEQKKQYDQYTWTMNDDGEVRFCFSNEFSTVTHKVVYFDFQAGDDDPLIQPSKTPLNAMTQVDACLLFFADVLEANLFTHLVK